MLIDKDFESICKLGDSVDVNMKDSVGNSALSLAIYMIKNEKEDLWLRKVIKKLIEAKAKVVRSDI